MDVACILLPLRWSEMVRVAAYGCARFQWSSRLLAVGARPLVLVLAVALACAPLVLAGCCAV